MVKLQKTTQSGYPIVYNTGKEYARTQWAATLIVEEDGTYRLCTNSSMKVCSTEQEMRNFCKRCGWSF